MKGQFLGATGYPSSRQPAVYQGAGNTLHVAKPRSGKSRSLAIIGLTEMRGSVIVTDFKHELIEATSLYRSEVLGIPSVVFDPFHVVADRFLPWAPREIGNNVDLTGRNTPLVPIRGRIDPVDFVRKSANPLTAAHRIAEAFIPPPKGQENPYWSDGASNDFAAWLMFVALDPRIDLIAEIPEIVEQLDPPTPIKRDLKTLWMFMSSKSREKFARHMMVESKMSVVSDQGSMFHRANRADTGLSGIRSHLRTNLSKTLGEPKMLDALSGTNVDFSTLLKEPKSIYFVLPGHMAETHYRYMRLLNMIALTEIEESGLMAFDSSAEPIRCVIDEAATLGKFPTMVEAMGRMPGYGIRFHLYVQNLSQISDIYGQSGYGRIMGTVDCVQYFGGTNDTFTAKEMSERCGVGTIIKPSQSHDTGPGNKASTSEGTASRLVYTPDEVGTLPMPWSIVKLAGQLPTEVEVVPPDLRDFPKYNAFMSDIARGVAPKQAAKNCANIEDRWVYPTPQPIILQPPPPKPRKGLFDLLDAAVTGLMGHEIK